MTPLGSLWDTPGTREPLIAVLILAGSLALAKIARGLLAALAARIHRRTQLPLDEGLLAKVQAAMSLLVIVLGGRASLHALAATGRVADLANTTLFLLAVLLSLVFTIRAYQTLLSWYGRKAASEGASTIQAEFVPLAQSIGIVALSLLALSVALSHFGQSVSSLVVSLGVGSLAIGLAAQETLANMIAGFVILIDRPFAVGDMLELSPQHTGDVVHIGLRATTLRLPDGSTLVVPNGDLAKSRVHVLTRGTTPPLVRLNLAVTYDSDPETAKALAVEAARESALVLQDPPPKALLVEYGPSSLNILLLAWIADVRTKGDVLDDIHSRLLAKLRSSGIRFALPATEVHLTSAPPSLAR